MANVLVCIKRVPDVAGEVALTADGQGVDARHVGFTVSAHENCAVELAVRIASQEKSGTGTGGAATVLTLGTDDAVEQLRTALGLGCSAAVLIEADPGGFGPADVAREIAAVVEAHAAAGRTYDLVLLGNDAADTGDFQVGIRLAYALGRPVVNGASTVVVTGDVATAHVAGPDGVETYQVPLPAVVTVLEGGVEPRYPTISGRMKAKKVKVDTVAAQREPRGSGRARLLLPPAQPSAVEVLGEGPDAAKAVVDLLEKLGVAR
jgi:electron transfer flavoprotein beta subunit